MRGSARAAALPQLFAPAATPYGCALRIQEKQSFIGAYEAVQITDAGFGSPRRPIYLPPKRNSSNRPVETITPLAAALNLTYDDKHSDSDYAKVASDILTHSQYAGKVVLVCWHHGNIPALATALGVSNPPNGQARYSIAFGRLPFRTERPRWRMAPDAALRRFQQLAPMLFS